MRSDFSLDTTKRRRAGGIWFGVFMVDVVLTLADGDASTEMLSSIRRECVAVAEWEASDSVGDSWTRVHSANRLE
ncbi:hypothetical protein GBA52_011760 [Prunus armeniaca]|nr:hypothetical protein GBA52_011760 [Prunus armeniaca]